MHGTPARKQLNVSRVSRSKGPKGPATHVEVALRRAEGSNGSRPYAQAHSRLKQHIITIG